MADIDNLSIQIDASAKKAMPELDKMIKKLEQLSASLTRTSTHSFRSFSNSVNVATKSMNNFSNAISQTKLGNVRSQLEAFSKLDFSNLSNVKQQTESITNLAKAISKFGSNGVTNAVTNIPKIGSSISTLLSSIANSPDISPSKIQALMAISNMNFAGAGSTVQTASKSIGNTFNGMSGSIGSFAKSAGSAAMKGLSVPVKAMGTGLSLVGKSAKSAASAVAKLLSQRNNGTLNSLQSLVGIIGRLYAKVWAIRRLGSFLTGSIGSSTDMIETYHYFEVAMKKIGDASKDNWSEYGAESAEAYASSFRDNALELTKKMSGYQFDEEGYGTYTGEKNLGIDADMLMNYQAQFAQQAYGIGMVGEAAASTSQALTMLAGDWSSLRNLSFEESYSKMASALAGQSRAVRSLGIDITQATLAQYAANLGITANITKMTQAQKAELRMIAILDQSRIAWGDLADTLNTPANQMRLIQQNMASLARTIGNLFIPVVEKVLPYINGLVMALRRLFEWLGALIGVKPQKAVSSMGGLGDVEVEDEPMEDLLHDTDALGDSADETDDKMKELKRTILGFDELNVLNDNDEDSTDKSKDNDKNKAKGMTPVEQGLLDDALFDLLDEYRKKWDEAFAKMQDKAKEIADAIANFGKNVWDFIQAEDWEGLGKYVAGEPEKGLQWIYDKIKWDNVKDKIVPFVEKVANAFNGIIKYAPFELAGRVLGAGLETISRTLNTWYDTFDFPQLGRKLNEFVKGLTEEDWWTPMGNLLGNRFMTGWKIFSGFVENESTFAALGIRIGELLNGIFDRVDFVLIGNALANGVNAAFTLLYNAITTFDAQRAAENLKNGLNRFVEKTNFAKIGLTLGELAEKAIESIYTVVDGFKSTELAAKMNTALWTFKSKINFEMLGKTIGTAWNKMWEFLDEFLQPSKWESYGTDLATTINGALSVGKDSLSTGKAGTTMADAFNSFFAMIKGLVEGSNGSDGIHWDDLATSISTNLNNFIDGIDTENASATLKHTIGVILGSMLDGVKKTHFYTLGKKVGDFFKDIDWFDWFNTAKDIVIESIGQFFKGVFSSVFGDFGENFMSGFIQGIKDVLGFEAGTLKVIAEALGKLADAIAKFSPETIELVGKALGFLVAVKFTTSLADNVGKFVGGLIGLKNVTSGGFPQQIFSFSGALKSLASNIGGVLTAAGIGATAAGVGIGYLAVLAADIQKLGEQLAGYNGILSSTGTLAQDTITKMIEAGTLKKEQGLELLQLIDDCENAGMTMDETTSTLVQKMGEYGVSYGQVVSAIQGSGEHVEEAVDTFIEKAEELKENADNNFGGASISVKDAVDAIRSSITTMGTDSEEVGFVLQELLRQLDMSITGSAENGGQVISQFTTIMQDQFGLSDEAVQALIDSLQLKFPEAVLTGTSSAASSMQQAEADITQAAGKIESSVSSSSSTVERTMSGNFGKAQAEASKQIALAKKNVEENTGKIETKTTEDFKNTAKNTDTEFENLSTNAKGKMTQLGTDLSSLVTNGISTPLHTRFRTIADALPNHFNKTADNIGLKFDGVTDKIAGYFSDIDTKIGAKINEVKLNEEITNICTQFDDTTKKIAGRFSNIDEKIGDKVKTVTLYSEIADIEKQFDGVNDNIAQKFSGLGQSILNSIGDLEWVGSNIMGSLTRGLSTNRHIDLPHIVQSGVNHIEYGNGAWVDVPLFSVDWYAKGGLFDSATIAGIGEAGAEAVIPLTNKSTLKKIAGAILEGLGASINGSGADSYKIALNDLTDRVTKSIDTLQFSSDKAIEVVENMSMASKDREAFSAKTADEALHLIRNGIENTSHAIDELRGSMFEAMFNALEASRTDRPIEVHSDVYIDKTKITREVFREAKRQSLAHGVSLVTV